MKTCTTALASLSKKTV